MSDYIRDWGAVKGLSIDAIELNRLGVKMFDPCNITKTLKLMFLKCPFCGHKNTPKVWSKDSSASVCGHNLFGGISVSSVFATGVYWAGLDGTCHYSGSENIPKIVGFFAENPSSPEAQETKGLINGCM